MRYEQTLAHHLSSTICLIYTFGNISNVTISEQACMTKLMRANGACSLISCTHVELLLTFLLETGSYLVLERSRILEQKSETSHAFALPRPHRQ
jgi:hypothetical protein